MRSAILLTALIVAAMTPYYNNPDGKLSNFLINFAFCILYVGFVLDIVEFLIK